MIGIPSRPSSFLEQFYGDSCGAFNREFGKRLNSIVSRPPLDRLTSSSRKVGTLPKPVSHGSHKYKVRH